MLRPMRHRAARPPGRAVLLSLSLLLGCVRSAPPTTSPRSEDPSTGAPATAPVATGAQGERALGATSVFADLVRQAEPLEGADLSASEAAYACLLARAEPGFTLKAPVHQALRPLPQPASDLGGALKQARSVQVLTPWGRYGAESSLVLASFTAFTPARRGLAVLLTRDGVSVRDSAPDGDASIDNAPVDSLAAWDLPEDAVVFVTAEAQVPLSQVYRVLETLARRRASVALATVLPPHTRTPSAASPSAATKACPDGLLAIEAVEGDLSRDAILFGLSPLRERAPDCLLRGEAPGAAGGLLELALRIDPSGQVSEACLLRDEVADAAVGACVLELARSLRFSPPSPAGVVDVQLPLVLRPHSTPAPAPVCAPTEVR
jgi:hypothetical protein